MLKVSHASISVECLFSMTLLRGVTRSKQMTMRWMRKAADSGRIGSCMQLANRMYGDWPYARDVGRVEEAAGAAASAGFMDGHDVPADVLADVVFWMQKGCVTGQYHLSEELHGFRKEALEGARFCANDGCEVVGHLKDFKVCPQCKTARYCGDECQKQDWTTGGTRQGVAHSQGSGFKIQGSGFL